LTKLEDQTKTITKNGIQDIKHYNKQEKDMRRNVRAPPQFNSALRDGLHFDWSGIIQFEWHNFNALTQHTASQCYTLDDVIFMYRYNLNIDLQEYFQEYPRYDFVVFNFLLLVLVLLILRHCRSILWRIFIVLLKLLTVFGNGCILVLQCIVCKCATLLKCHTFDNAYNKMLKTLMLKVLLWMRIPLSLMLKVLLWMLKTLWSTLNSLSFLWSNIACIAEDVIAATLYTIVASSIQTCCLHCNKLYLLLFLVCNVHILCNSSILDRGCLLLCIASALSFFFKYEKFVSPDILCVLLGAVAYCHALEAMYDKWLVHNVCQMLISVFNKYGIRLNFHM
jgi:hypothetical protein